MSTASSTRWGLEVTSAVEDDDVLSEEVRRLESTYDEELLKLDQDDE